MNAKKTRANSRQLLVFAPGAPYEVGEACTPWRHHITLVPSWFTRANQERLDKELKDLARRTRPIAVTLGERALMGPREVPASLINDTKNRALSRLHTDLLGALSESGASLQNYDYLGYKWQPHISDVQGREFEQSLEITIDHMAVVDAAIQTRPVVGRVYELGNPQVRGQQ